MLFALAPIAQQNAGAQTLSFTSKAGDKYVSITSLPPGVTGEIYCQINGGTPGKQAIQSASDRKPPFKLACGGKLEPGAAVQVYLMDRNNIQKASAPMVVSSDARKGPLWGVSVTANGGDKAVKVTTTGTPPATMKPADIHILIGPAPGTDVTAAGAIGPDANGTFTVPLNPAVTVKNGDQITLNVLGTTWTGVAGSTRTVESSAAGAAKISVTFTPAPKDTQTAIGGTLGGDNATLAQVQAVYVEVLNGTGSGADVVQGPVDGKYSPSTYSFNATNLKALAEGQSVHVHVCGSPPPAVSFTGDLTKGQPAIANISSTASLKPGGAVTGTNVPSGATIVSVDSATQITISQNAADSGAKVALQFAAGGSSCAQAGPQGTTGASGAKAALVEIVAKDAAQEVTSLYDLGRLKTYFSAGAEFQASNGSLGGTSGFFDVEIDQNWVSTGPDRAPRCFSKGDSAAYKSQNGDTGDCGSHPFRFLVNTYTDAELTQIPLTSNSPQPAAPAAGSGSASAATSTSTSTSTSGTFDISAAKGAYVEGGIYTPLLFPSMQWIFRGQANGFFIAPLAKYIFLDPDSPPAGATTGFNVYRAYGGGFRLGHFQLPAHFRKQGPELLSFLDVTAGRWENYREPNGTRGARLDVTGRYKIPYTLLYIGFDANAGPGGSDFRLFVGTRVDVASILGKLLPSAN